MKRESWFQRLDFKENPLAVKPSDIVIGRTKLQDDLFTDVKDGGMLALLGQYGLGKTSMLKYIIKHARGKRRIIYFACNRLTGPLKLDELLYERFGMIGKLLKIKSKKMILLLDEVEHLSNNDFKNVAKYFADEYFHTVLLVTNRAESIPKFMHAKVHNLTPLPAKDAIEIIKYRLVNTPVLTDAVLGKIYNYDPRIRKFLSNTERVIQYKVERQVSVRPSDIAKILIN